MVNYKAIPYKVKNNKGMARDNEGPWNNSCAYDTPEVRYCIISTETGEILDDAQGYGYKTAKKAYSAYSYKTRDKSKDKEKVAKKEHIVQWMKEHKSFVRFMDEIAIEIAKGSWGPDDKFDVSLVEEMLANHELEPDFSANELLRVWKSR